MPTFKNFPQSYHDAQDWTWQDFQPFAQDILQRPLTPATIDQWLHDEGRLTALLNELFVRHSIATNADTSDEEAQRRDEAYKATVWQHAAPFFTQVERKLIDAGLQPDGYQVALRDIHAQAEIKQRQNPDLSAQVQALRPQYNRLVGGQNLEWEGETQHINQLTNRLQDPDRATREKVFRRIEERQSADRAAIDAIWTKLMRLRKQITQQAGFDNYRDYMWLVRRRFDYTPDDALNFCRAIKQVVVPLTEAMREKQRQRLGLPVLKPWDAEVDGLTDSPLPGYGTSDDLLDKLQIFLRRIEPDFAQHLITVREKHLLDIDPRPNKYPYSYNERLMFSRQPFIFYNCSGGHSDIPRIAHELGHAIHYFEMGHLPSPRQQVVPMEFGEVPSTLLESMISDHLDLFYTGDDLPRARQRQLQELLFDLPYTALTVEFQHWVYTHHDAATDPAACDDKWLELWAEYMKGVDYADAPTHVTNNWRHLLRLFFFPFYAIEYALAQVGAVQIWRNIEEDRAAGVKALRKAMALGSTRPLPDLFQVAGSQLAFDVAAVERAVDYLRAKISAAGNVP